MKATHAHSAQAIEQTTNGIGTGLMQQRIRLLNTLVAATAVAASCCGGAMAAKLPVAAVTASANDGNVPENTLDGSLATRWSASGDGQWIRFDLGASTTIGTVKIAWYQGNQRSSTFDIQTSDNASSWATVFTGVSSGSTTALESYNVSDSVRRYLRVVGHGNSQNLWNSITEVEMYSDSGGPVSTEKLLITTTKVSNGQRVTLQWNGMTNAVSQVQAGARAGTWANLGPVITNVGGLQAWQEVVPSSSPIKFYRVKQTPYTPPTTNLPPPTIGKVYAKVPMGSKKMPCYINRPIDQYDPRVTRAIIVLHGAGANASAYFDRIDNVIPSSWDDKVMVISPHFQEAPASGDWGWPDDDWREAGASGGISSFTVLDLFVELLRNNGKFPNLKWVVVTGHSAGGQTTQRFASFTDVDAKPWPNAQYMKFVVANPSSYLYLNQYRNPEGDSSWVIPSPDCSEGNGYNEWKYGLEGLYGYTASRGTDWARTHLPARQVLLLAGTEDNYDNGDLDTDCAAMWQGPHRYARAHIFKMFMDKYYPVNRLGIADVPGVDHDSTRMYASPQGVSALFFAD